MVEIKVRTRMDVQKVLRRSRRGGLDSLGRAGAYLRTVMKRTLGNRKNPRAPGQPASSPTGHARRSILFAVDKRSESVIVGPSYRRVGRAMYAHEFGRKHHGQKFPARPFAGPALQKALPALSPFWQGVIKP